MKKKNKKKIHNIRKNINFNTVVVKIPVLKHYINTVKY